MEYWVYIHSIHEDAAIEKIVDTPNIIGETRKKERKEQPTDMGRPRYCWKVLSCQIFLIHILNCLLAVFIDFILKMMFHELNAVWNMTVITIHNIICIVLLLSCITKCYNYLVQATFALHLRENIAAILYRHIGIFTIQYRREACLPKLISEPDYEPACNPRPGSTNLGYWLSTISILMPLFCHGFLETSKEIRLNWDSCSRV